MIRGDGGTFDLPAVWEGAVQQIGPDVEPAVRVVHADVTPTLQTDDGGAGALGLSVGPGVPVHLVGVDTPRAGDGSGMIHGYLGLRVW